MSWSRPKGRLVLDRRTVLRGMLGGAAVALGLPALESMLNGNGTALAVDAALPRRFGLFFWGNGNRPDRWAPTGNGVGEAWQLSPALASLAPLKSKLTVVTGTSVKLPNDAPHSSGAAGLLTGSRLGDILDDDSFMAPSLDQVIAADVGGATLYRSIETGIANARGRSFNGPGARNPPETSAVLFYERIFGPTFRQPGEGQVDPSLARRRSVLDAVVADLGALSGKVGAADRSRLEQHTTGVRELELRLARLMEDPPDLSACLRPSEPEADFEPIDGRWPLVEANALMAELMAMALACDQTRVFSHWLTDPIHDLLFPGASAGHHDLTHNEGGDQPQVAAITERCVEAYAAFLSALDAVPEGDGTLLDHCAVLGCSEVSLGQTHSIQDMPILIGGSCAGTLKTDHHYRSLGAESASRVSLTLIQAMGSLRTSFGDGEGFADEPLDVLFV